MGVEFGEGSSFVIVRNNLLNFWMKLMQNKPLIRDIFLFFY
jgi:hypothetical protein